MNLQKELINQKIEKRLASVSTTIASAPKKKTLILLALAIFQSSFLILLIIRITTPNINASNIYRADLSAQTLIAKILSIPVNTKKISESVKSALLLKSNKTINKARLIKNNKLIFKGK